MAFIRIIAPSRDFRYVAKHPLDLAEVLARSGFRVEVLCPMPVDVIPLHRHRGFKIVPLTNMVGDKFQPIKQYEYYSLAFFRSLTPADITIGVDTPGFMIAHLLKKFRRTRCLVYYAMELCLPNETPNQRTVRYQARYIQDADLVITTGEHRSQILKDRFSLHEQPMVIHNSFVTPTNVGEPNLRQTLIERGFAPAEKLAIVSGQLIEQHALTSIVKSMSAWPPGTGLVLSGLPDQEYIKIVLDLASQIDVANRVYYIGAVPSGIQNMLKLISGADVGLVLKRYRGGILNDVYYTPTKLFEYAAMGVPIVCSDQHSLHLVEQEGWGISVDPDDPHSIAGGIIALLSDTVRLKQMGIVARQRFYDYYCMEVQGRRLICALKSLGF